MGCWGCTGSTGCPLPSSRDTRHGPSSTLEELIQPSRCSARDPTSPRPACGALGPEVSLGDAASSPVLPSPGGVSSAPPVPGQGTSKSPEGQGAVWRRWGYPGLFSARRDGHGTLISSASAPGPQLKLLRKSGCDCGFPAKRKTRAADTGRSQLRGLVPAGQTGSALVKPRLCGRSGGDPPGSHARWGASPQAAQQRVSASPGAAGGFSPCPGVTVTASTGAVGVGLGSLRAWPIRRGRAGGEGEARSRGGQGQAELLGGIQGSSG